MKFMREMALMLRSEVGGWLRNSPMRTDVSAKRLAEVAGSDNCFVAYRRLEMVEMPYVWQTV